MYPLVMRKNGYRLIFDAFTNVDRTVHLSPGAVFVRSKDGTSFHELVLDEYCLSGHTGESVPRLAVNHSKKPLPYAVAAKWKIERREHSTYQAIELTLLEEEFAVAFAGLPKLIDHIEAGYSGAPCSAMALAIHSSTSALFKARSARSTWHSRV